MTTPRQLPVTAPATQGSRARLTRSGVADGCRVIEVDEASGASLDRVAWLAEGGANPGSAFLTTLRQGSWAVPLVAGDLLLSYVTRSSPSSLCVQTSLGRQRRIDAGGLMLCAGQQPQLRRAKARGGPACEVIDLVLPDVAMATTVSVQPDEATVFVNTRSTCIRILLGRWGMHGARFEPLPRFWLLDVDIIPGADVELPVHSCAVNVLVTSGTLHVDGQELGAATPLIRRGAAESIAIASSTGASLLMFSSGR